jgi:hypothetical protein
MHVRVTCFPQEEVEKSVPKILSDSLNQILFSRLTLEGLQQNLICFRDRWRDIFDRLQAVSAHQ